MTLARIDARATEKADLLPIGALTHLWGHDADGDVGKMPVSIMDVRSFGVLLDGSQSASVMWQKCQDAVDFGDANNIGIFFPAFLYEIGSSLKYYTNSTIYLAGIDKTIFKLADSAVTNANCWEPSARDGSVVGASFIGGMTCDGNYTRTADVVPTTYPNASCFITAGAKRLTIQGGIKVQNAILHGIDICNGGEGGNYVSEANEAYTYYPANESADIWIDRIIADNCGDDGWTGHYSKNVYIGHAITLSAGHRHPSTNASNGGELDDGCRGWKIGHIDARGGTRGLAIKAHDPGPGPSDIQIDTIITDNCRIGIAAVGTGAVRGQSENIRIGSIIVRNPGVGNPDDSTTRRAVWFQRYRDLQIGSILVQAKGDEAFDLASGVYFTDLAGRNQIGPISVEKWPWNNTTTDNLAGVAFYLTSENIDVGPVNVIDSGKTGVYDYGATNVRIARIDALRNDAIAGSTAYRSVNDPYDSDGELGFIKATGYDTKASIAGKAFPKDGKWRMLYQSSVARTHTGSTTETTVLTLSDIIPAHAMGANGRLRITTLWSASVNDASVKTGRVKLAGMTIDSAVLTSFLAQRKQLELGNVNSEAAQIATGISHAQTFGQSGGAVAQYTLDTTLAMAVTVTIQNGSAADSVTLRSISVEVLSA